MRKITEDAGPLTIHHLGQLPSVTVAFNLKPGVSLGQSAQAAEEALREMRMPPTISANFQGTVKEFQQSFKGLSVLLIVAILFITAAAPTRLPALRKVLCILGESIDVDPKRPLRSVANASVTNSVMYRAASRIHRKVAM